MEGGREKVRVRQKDRDRVQHITQLNGTDLIKCTKKSLFKGGSTMNMQTHLKNIISPTKAHTLCLLHVPDFCFWLFSLLQQPTHPHTKEEKCNRISGGVTFDGVCFYLFIL